MSFSDTEELMISFDEYMGFSDSEEVKEKKPGKIRQFFKKHGKKIAVGAGVLGAGILGYMIGRRGSGANNGANSNGATKPKTTTPNNTVTKVTTLAKSATPVVANQNATEQGTNGLSRDTLSQLNAQANARARQQNVARYAKSRAIYSPNFKIAKQIKANNRRFGTA